MPDPVFFASAADWRAWLAEHHDSRRECLVAIVKVTSGEANMSWSESVDQALCFGWIDGVRRRIDDRCYAIRFTPRKSGSIWSAINVKKMAALAEAGLVMPAGESAYARRTSGKTAIYSYERAAESLNDDEAAMFAKDRPAWSYFSSQAAWYQRTATHWVVGAKRADTRARRLAQLIADSAEGQRLGHLRGDR